MHDEVREEIFRVHSLHPGRSARDLHAQAHGQHKSGDAGPNPSEERVEREESCQQAVHQLHDDCGGDAHEERVDLCAHSSALSCLAHETQLYASFQHRAGVGGGRKVCIGGLELTIRRRFASKAVLAARAVSSAFRAASSARMAASSALSSANASGLSGFRSLSPGCCDISGRLVSLGSGSGSDVLGRLGSAIPAVPRLAQGPPLF